MIKEGQIRKWISEDHRKNIIFKVGKINLLQRRPRHFISQLNNKYGYFRDSKLLRDSIEVDKKEWLY